MANVGNVASGDIPGGNAKYISNAWAKEVLHPRGMVQSLHKKAQVSMVKVVNGTKQKAKEAKARIIMEVDEGWEWQTTRWTIRSLESFQLFFPQIRCHNCSAKGSIIHT